MGLKILPGIYFRRKSPQKKREMRKEMLSFFRKSESFFPLKINTGFWRVSWKINLAHKSMDPYLIADAVNKTCMLCISGWFLFIEKKNTCWERSKRAAIGSAEEPLNWVLHTPRWIACCSPGVPGIEKSPWFIFRVVCQPVKSLQCSKAIKPVMIGPSLNRHQSHQQHWSKMEWNLTDIKK